MYIFIAFLAPVFYAIANIVECQLSNKTFKRQTTMIFYISMMNCVFVPLVLFLGTPTIPPYYLWGFYLFLAFLDVAYLYPYYTALKVIDTSIVGSLFSLGQITIPILTYFLLNETLQLNQYIGFVIIIMASIALSIKNVKTLKLSRAFYYMLFVSFIRAFFIVAEKYVLNLDGNWINMVVYPPIISGLIPFVFLLNKGARKDIIKNFPPYLSKFKTFAFNEFMCFLGLVAAVYGLSGLSPVVSASISATMPIFMLLVSFILLKNFNICLKERVTRHVIAKKMFCFVLIVLGVILVVAH